MTPDQKPEPPVETELEFPDDLFAELRTLRARVDSQEFTIRNATKMVDELDTLRARVGELETWNANQAEQIRTLERTLDCEEGRACDAEARAESAEARVRELERAFRNLVARIDGDGGQSQEGGTVAGSLERADTKVVTLQARVRELEACLTDLHLFAGRGDGHETADKVRDCIAGVIIQLRANLEKTEVRAEFARGKLDGLTPEQCQAFAAEEQAGFARGIRRAVEIAEERAKTTRLFRDVVSPFVTGLKEAIEKELKP